MHTNPPLWQFQYAAGACIDLQLVIQQLALGSFFMLAALWQMVGAAASRKKDGAAQGGADQAKTVAGVHDISGSLMISN
ncbi:hypothetical protein NCCP436_09220 [Pseudomonas sp. NCCP-436]|nr:hypothetical protein NCCP436_09220 [Pseudomonas sp. NCCP-436]